MQTARVWALLVGLVSGSSPTIVKSLLDPPKEFTTEGIMLKAIMVDRYAL